MKIFRMVLLALTLTYSVAKADIVLVPDFRVDQDPTPNSTQFGGIASSLAYGYFVVTYTYTGNNYTLMARRFDLNGNPLGNAFRINSTPSSAGAAGPKVAIDSNGNMNFTWTDNRTGQSHIYLKRFDYNENPLNSDTVVDQGTRGVLSSISSFSGGGFVIDWADSRGVAYSIYARIYDSTGTPIGNDFRIDQNPDVDTNYGASSFSVVATSSTGGIYFAWVDARNTGSASSRDIYARLFDSSGNPLGNDFRVTTASNVFNGMPSIAAAPDGNFIVGWSDYRNDPFLIDTDVFARTFDSNGTPFGNDFQINSVTPGGGGQIACAPSGRCMILVGEGTHLFGRHMSSDGTLLDTEFQIDSGIPAYDAFTNIAGANSFITAWGDRRTGNYQVWANIIGPLEGNGIPTLSAKTTITLAILFLLVVILRAWTFRKKMFLSLIVLFVALHAGSAVAEYMCYGGQNSPTKPNPCGCNNVAYADLPPGAVNLKLVDGDDSQAENRINIFLLGEGWDASEQDNFNEQVNSFIESLKVNPTYAAYFDFMNFYRVNVKSPQHGTDVLPIPLDAYYGEGPIHSVVYDDEDPSVFSTTGNWYFVASSDAYQGSGYHIASSDQPDVSAKWQFTFPDSYVPPGTVYIGASWRGSSANTSVKYSVTKNGQILNANIIKDQRVGLGKFMEQGNNDIIYLSGVKAGDIIEITVQPYPGGPNGYIIADSLMIFNLYERPNEQCSDSYFNFALYYWTNESNGSHWVTAEIDGPRIIDFVSNAFGPRFDPDKVFYVIIVNNPSSLAFGLGGFGVIYPMTKPYTRPLIHNRHYVHLAHELAHSQAKVIDEHHGFGCNYTMPPPPHDFYSPNMSYIDYITANNGRPKWRHLMAPDMSDGPESIYKQWLMPPDSCTNDNILLPHNTCLMDGAIDNKFGALCEETVIQQFYDKLSYAPINGVTPDASGIMNLYDNQQIIFLASTIKTAVGLDKHDSITRTWTLNGINLPIISDFMILTSDDVYLQPGTNTLTLSVDDTNPALVEKHPYCYGWPLNGTCIDNNFPDNPPYDQSSPLLPELKTWTINRVSGPAPAAPLISGTTGSITVTNPGPVIIQATVVPGAGDTGIRSVTILYAHSDGIWHIVPMIRNGITNDYSAELFEVPEGPVTDNYTYMIQAVGNNGQVAQAWDTPPDTPYTITVSVPAPPDTVAPVFIFASVQSDTGNATGVNIIARVEDDADPPLDVDVYLEVSFNGGSSVEVEMNYNSATSVYEGVISPFPSDAETSAAYFLKAVDDANNTSYFTNDGLPFEFSVDNVLPHISGTTELSDTNDVNGPYFITTTVTESTTKSPPTVTLTYAYSYYGLFFETPDAPMQDIGANNYEGQAIGPSITSEAYYYIKARDKWGNTSIDPVGAAEDIISKGYHFHIEDDQAPVCWGTTQATDLVYPYMSPSIFQRIDSTCMDNAWWGDAPVYAKAFRGINCYRDEDLQLVCDWSEDFQYMTLTRDSYTDGLWHAIVDLPIPHAPREVCYYIQVWDQSGKHSTDPQIDPQHNAYCFNVVYPFTPGTLFVSGEGDIMSGRHYPIYTYNWLTGNLEMFVDVYDILKQTQGVTVDEDGIVHASMIGVHAMAYDPLSRELYFTYLYQRSEDSYFSSGLGKVDAAKNVEFVFQTGDQAFANPMQDIVFTDSGMLIGTIPNPDPDPAKKWLVLWAYDPRGNQSWPNIIFDAIALDGWGGVPLTSIGNDVYAPGPSPDSTILKIFSDNGTISSTTIDLPVQSSRVRELASDDQKGFVYLYTVEPDGCKIRRFDSNNPLVGPDDVVIYAPLDFPLQSNGPVIEVDPLTGYVVMQQFLRMIDPDYAGGGWSLYNVLEGDTIACLLDPSACLLDRNLGRRITTSTILEPTGDIVFSFVPAKPRLIVGELWSDTLTTSLSNPPKDNWVEQIWAARTALVATPPRYQCAWDLLDVFSGWVDAYSGSDLRSAEKVRLLTLANVAKQAIKRLPPEPCDVP